MYCYIKIKMYVIVNEISIGIIQAMTRDIIFYLKTEMFTSVEDTLSISFIKATKIVKCSSISQNHSVSIYCDRKGRV